MHINKWIVLVFPFVLSRTSRVELNIYNVQGRLIHTLVNRRLTAGSYTFLWAGRDGSGKMVSS